MAVPGVRTAHRVIERHRRRGDGVDHVGGRRAAADGEALEVAAGGAGDVRGQAGGIIVDVLAVARGNGERAGGGAVGDGDVALVGVDGGDAFARRSTASP